MIALLRKEFRSQLRERRAWLVPVICVALLASVSLMVFIGTSDRAYRADHLGESMASVVAVMQTLFVILIAPIVGAATIAGERERGTLSLLLASPVSRWAIAPAKVITSTLYITVILMGSLPVAATSFLLGGADMATLAGMFLTNLIEASALVCIGIYISTLFQRTWIAAMVALGVAAGMTVILSMLFGLIARGPINNVADNMFLMGFNPFCGLFLFFASDSSLFGPLAWLIHYGEMLVLGGAALMLAVSRLGRLRE